MCRGREHFNGRTAQLTECYIFTLRCRGSGLDSPLQADRQPRAGRAVLGHRPCSAHIGFCCATWRSSVAVGSPVAGLNTVPLFGLCQWLGGSSASYSTTHLTNSTNITRCPLWDMFEWRGLVIKFVSPMWLRYLGTNGRYGLTHAMLLTSAPESLCIQRDGLDMPKSGLQRTAAEIGAATKPEDMVLRWLVREPDGIADNDAR